MALNHDLTIKGGSLPDDLRLRALEIVDVEMADMLALWRLAHSTGGPDTWGPPARQGAVPICPAPSLVPSRLN